MPFTSSRKLALALIAALVVIAAVLAVAHFSADSNSAARGQLLRIIPPDSTAIIFLDLDALRQSPFLAKLYAWAPAPSEDSEYSQFVGDSGFSYERDLKHLLLAISNHGPTTDLLAIADGKFDRKKMELILNKNGTASQQGQWTVFHLGSTAEKKKLSVTFLSNQRIAITDATDLSAALNAASANPSRAEWNSRFERVAGTPFFAVIRQDFAIQSALNTNAPGSFRSPQLSALLNQLQWISLAVKPDGDQLRLVAEGECLSEPTTTQLRDFLQGIVLLAQNGLNDPKLRQQINPEERQAYQEILKGADVQKLDRGEWKSVRVVLPLTTKFLDVARAASAKAPPQIQPDSATSGTSVPTPQPAEKSRSHQKN